MEVESVFAQSVRVRSDTKHSHGEERYQAIGKGNGDRYIFLIFTLREREGLNFIRPISARYMHKKEIEYYEKEDPGF